MRGVIADPAALTPPSDSHVGADEYAQSVVDQLRARVQQLTLRTAFLSQELSDATARASVADHLRRELDQVAAMLPEALAGDAADAARWRFVRDAALRVPVRRGPPFWMYGVLWSGPADFDATALDAFVDGARAGTVAIASTHVTAACAGSGAEVRA